MLAIAHNGYRNDVFLTDFKIPIGLEDYRYSFWFLPHSELCIFLGIYKAASCPTYAGCGRDCSELVNYVPRQEVHIVIRQGHLRTFIQIELSVPIYFIGFTVQKYRYHWYVIQCDGSLDHLLVKGR